ncbi:hypothetical protein QN277_005717 [Acacia crassicarpa]|uniref:F-box domain-containing protein n=1 Tax=Acacia crassicarpa TaxID=499986 RepID=A0AAE1IZR5_9FABA|nr:hypothetical protein QN277_005717 [Acacia crassicarpa]
MKISEDRNITFIPYDIIANILRRLPVKSLIQFQCVSKDWENLIKSPSFIRDCLYHTGRPTPLLLLSQLGLTPRYCFQLLDPQSKQVLEIQNPPLIDSCSDLKIVGSCNGLVCLQVFHEDYGLYLPCSSNDSGTSPPYLLLWNPATRQFRKVPRTIEDFNVRHRLGFGFNPIDNDYKIVKLSSQFAVNPVEVYSLNSGSWEEVEFENLEGTIRISSWTNAVNGVVYWLGGKQRRSDDCDYSLVVSIDLTNQVCTSIPLPDLGSKKSRRLKLILYENKLAVLAITKSSLIHLWVMEEDTCASRGRWIWTKRYTCSLWSTRLSPFELNAATIWKSKIVSRPIRIFGDADETKRFCLIDLTTNEFKEFVIKCRRCNVLDINNYVESHVSVANINHKELQI